MGQISPLRSMPKCPWSLDNVGQICHLRGYWQNPSNIVGHGLQCGAKWITVEEYGGTPHYMYIYLYIH